MDDEAEFNVSKSETPKWIHINVKPTIFDFSGPMRLSTCDDESPPDPNED